MAHAPLLSSPSIRKQFFATPLSTALTLLSALLLLWVLPPLLQWAVFKATWIGTPEECHAHGGACWAFIAEKYRLILFGLYPYEEQYRPLLSSVLIIGLLLTSARPSNWKPWLGGAWVGGLLLFALLMWGGIPGLPFVSNDRWSGLPLTLILSVGGIGLSFPLAVLLALGRRSGLPGIRSLCTVYIELWRGVPLISVLFMASVMFPLFLPEGVTVDKLLRAQVGIILFTAAYVAEGLRGGLQAVPKGQFEAADALGFSYWKKVRLIILPQAIKHSIPALVGQFISTFKDTSLVTIIGLYDIMGTTRAATTDQAWRGFFIEGYAAAAIFYFIFTFSMSRYSRFIEQRLRREHQ